MSETPARYGTPVRTLTDGEWTARYMLSEGRMAIVIEQSLPDGDGVPCAPDGASGAAVAAPLTRDRLDEAGAAIGDAMIREGSVDRP